MKTIERFVSMLLFRFQSHSPMASAQKHVIVVFISIPKEIDYLLILIYRVTICISEINIRWSELYSVEGKASPLDVSCFSFGTGATARGRK